MVSARLRYAGVLTIVVLPLWFWFFRYSGYIQGSTIRVSQHRDVWFDETIFTAGKPKPGVNATYSRTLVMGKMRSEDVSWVSELFPDLHTAVYEVESPDSGLPANKGHEAMIYLTYIIDHYDNLPEVVLFFHPHSAAWHNNVLNDLSSATTIARLSSPHVIRQGYVNSRCHHDPGCPNWLVVDRSPWLYDEETKPEERYLTSEVFHALHPGVDIPPTISQPCCAQFAVSGERIRSRPLGDYQRYRKWLLETDLPDKTSGRIMEYTWQYIFTGVFEWCPPQSTCYCDGYGICFEGGEIGLQNWLKILKNRERLDQRLSDLFDAGKLDSEEYKTSAKAKIAVAMVLDEMKANAMQRGADPAIRAADCGRVWHEGDGY